MVNSSVSVSCQGTPIALGPRMIGLREDDKLISKEIGPDQPLGICFDE